MPARPANAEQPLPYDEIWLPAEAHFVGSARLMLFKGMRVDETSQYSEYKKFTVDTRVTFRRDKIRPDY